jgi:iron(III) transport system ATP-binding protein
VNNFFEIDNVTFIASKKNKVSNVTLKIENEGDVVCLLGPSGIGKNYYLKNYCRIRKD